MNNEIKMLRIWRYHRFSETETKMVEISLYESGICIKLYNIFKHSKLKKECYTAYVYSHYTYMSVICMLVEHGLTLNLAKKIEVLLYEWYSSGVFCFQNNGEIVVDFNKLKNR